MCGEGERVDLEIVIVQVLAMFGFDVDVIVNMLCLLKDGMK